MKCAIGNFFAIVSLALFACSTAQQSCNTPSGKQGACIIIDQCAKLDEIYRNRYRSPEETRLLRNSQCGQENRRPKVCCESETSACRTPDGDEGECIIIQNCPALYQLANLPKPLSQEVLTYLRSSSCTGASRFSVCCSGRTPSIARPNKISSSNLLPAAGECGSHQTGDRIVGGEEADIDAYAWMALIEYRSKTGRITQSCGGSLISKRYVLTAAHCVTGAVLTAVGTPISVRLGEYDKSNNGKDCVKVAGGTLCNEDPLVIPIEKIVPHAEFEKNIRGPKNDIALIRMARDVQFTDFIQPICLPDVDSFTSESELIAAGWGATENRKTNNIKLFVSLPFKEQDYCVNAYASINVIVTMWDKQICAGGETGKDSCRGDSGGPLMLETENQPIRLIGVVSYGPTPCAKEGVPGVYTKVFGYLDWIKETLEP